MRALDQTKSTIMIWCLPQASGGCLPLTFLNTVARDVGIEIDDLRGAILDRELKV